MVLEDYIPADIRKTYEVHDWLHAAAILATEFKAEFGDICTALREFRITKDEVTRPGGNESDIPKNLSKILRPLGWEEKNSQPSWLSMSKK